MQGRDENGKFKKGVSGNPNGRPRKKREIRFYEITQTACTFEDWKEIVKVAVEDAKKGDATSRKWLSDYLMGAPQQYLDMTTKGDKVGLIDNEETIAEAIAIVNAHKSSGDS